MKALRLIILSLVCLIAPVSAAEQEPYEFHFLPASAATWNEATATATVAARQDYTTNQTLWGQFYGLVDGEYKALLKPIDISLAAFNGKVKQVVVRAKSGAMLVGNITFNAETGEVKKSLANESDLIIVEDIPEGTAKIRFFVRPNVGDNESYIIYATLADGSVSAADSNGKALAYNNIWLGHIPGKTPFNQVTIPGTHDSATYGTSLPITKTQYDDLNAQLAAGLRAFDLRPRYNANSQSEIELANLTIYHGGISTGVKFKDAMDTFVKFVKENPTETVVVRIQKEDSKLLFSLNDYTSTWRQSIRSWIESNKDYMLPKITSTLTLNSCRGKIVLLSNTPYGSDDNPEDYVCGGRLSWSNNAEQEKTRINYTNGTKVADATVEDMYEDIDTNKKIAVSQTNITSAANDATNRWYITYTSLSGSPESYAKTVNPAILSHINTLSKRAGIVLMDYATGNNATGAALTAALIALNQKHTLSPLTTATRYTDHAVSVSSANPAMGSASVQGVVEGRAVHGAHLIFTATPREDFQFLKWSDGSPVNPHNTHANSDLNLVASFTKTDGIEETTGSSQQTTTASFDLTGRPAEGQRGVVLTTGQGTGTKKIIR